MVAPEPHSSPVCPAWRFARLLAVVAGLYFLTALVGLSLANFGDGASLVWPPTGIAVAALTRCGLRLWPGVFAGSLAVNLITATGPAVFGITAGNTLGPVLAAWVLRRAGFDAGFRQQRDVILFVGVALGAMVVNAVNGGAWVCLTEPAKAAVFRDIVWAWWLGDAGGVLVVGAALLAAGAGSWAEVRRRGEFLGAVSAVAAAAALGLAAAAPILPSMSFRFPFLLFQALIAIWATLRYRLGVGAVCVLAIAAAAVCVTAAGVGPFATDVNPRDGLIRMWAFVVGLSVVCLHLTALMADRDRAADALQASEADYRALVEGNPALIVRFTRAGVITFVNDTFCVFENAARDHLVGRAFVDLITGPSRDPVAALLAANPDVIEFQGPFHDAAGAERWIEWKGRAVPHGLAGAVEYQVIGIDVTNFHRAEENRRAVEQQMFQAQKLESLGVMAGGIAHDFNNLLFGVLGYADLAAEMLAPDHPARDHLARLRESVRRASDLTRQLLAYAGKGELAVRPLDLNDLLRSTADLLAVSVPKAVAVRFETAARLPPVRGDETQLRQVLMNLVINAGEAIGPAPGAITLRTDVTRVGPPARPSRPPGSADEPPADPPGLPAGRYVRVRVADTGSGMPDDVKRKIFDPFFSTKFAGRGLGLAAVQGIVVSHGGAIHVDSEPGRGTEFVILLPAMASDADTEFDDADESDSAPALVPPPATARLALLVEDDEPVRGLLRQYLTKLGWRVVEARDGREGLAAFRRDAAVRLVILDLTMPEMNGTEVFAAIRAETRDVPVIVCTGDGGPIPDPLAAAGVEVLRKPFRFGDLEAAVARATAT